MAPKYRTAVGNSIVTVTPRTATVTNVLAVGLTHGRRRPRWLSNYV
jgi:hypothetical protein